MATIQLVWIGDLDSDSRSTSTADHRLRPRRIDIGSGQKEVKFGRENTKNPPDYCLESSINNRMVSRKHATIERSSSGGNYMLYDHSLNGTYVNYQRVSGAVHLKPGDIVCFGHLNGANIKAGEAVAPYHSDLKYKVELVEGKGGSTVVDKKKKAAAAAAAAGKQKRDSRAAFNDEDEDSSDDDSKKNSSTKKASSKGGKAGKGSAGGAQQPPPKKARRSSESSQSLSSSSSSDSELENTTMRLAGSATKKSSKENGGKKSSLSGRKPGKKPVRKTEAAGSAPTPSGPSTKKSGGSGVKKGAGGGAGGPAALTAASAGFHYENEECSATPCRRPEDLAIDWIQCDRCTKWYHQICVGMSTEEEVDDSEAYYCPKCKK